MFSSENVFPNSCQLRDFTVGTQKGAIRQLHLLSIAKNQARGLDEVPHTRRFQSVQAFMPGPKKKKKQNTKQNHTYINLGVTK